MSTRQSRSGSIPTPRAGSSTSPTRNIESVISIPFSTYNAPPPRPRISTAQPISVQYRNSDDPRARRSNPASLPPTRSSAARSMSYSAPGISLRSSSRPSTFEPRIVRADSADPACLPSSSSASSFSIPPARPRRTSAAGVQTQRATLAPAANVTVPARPTPFTCPAYLEHSALRHLLQTEAPPVLPPSRKAAVTRRSPTPSDSDDDGSPPPRRSTSMSMNITIPTRWSERHRHETLSISEDGRDVTYQGASCNGEKDAAAVRTTNPIPPACGIYYYEVEILSKGNKGHISIGFAGKDVRISRLPGWERDSWGYHGDDGCSFAAEKNGTPFGPKFECKSTGDIVGCGIDFSTYQAFYTHKGRMIGSVFKDVGKHFELYPSIGLRHSGEAVRANFGQAPFLFPIDYYVHQQRVRNWSNIMTTPIGSPPNTEQQTKAALDKLVLAYLAHHGYAKTARAFQKQAAADDVEMDGTTAGMDAEIDNRMRIVNFVNQGDIDSALQETERLYPGVLGADEGLMRFKLRCRKFVELLLRATALHKRMDEDKDGMEIDEHGSIKAQVERALSQAIVYGQSLLSDYESDKRPEVQALFTRTVSLVAWHDPIERGGITAQVAGPEARTELANELNQAILRSQGQPANPALETVYRHTSACIHQLGISGVGAAAFADMRKEFIDA
ncbi:unnamed protein product [Mycena citricolor]|uniref:SPRY-domain-containing protein n=1 Tax=Mycena citricolor TaxID=2018698 RepID=A0AAD2HTK2_9AGAR|nr:unnamed protein product [Mycena citricolor]